MILRSPVLSLVMVFLVGCTFGWALANRLGRSPSRHLAQQAPNRAAGVNGPMRDTGRGIDPDPDPASSRNPSSAGEMDPALGSMVQETVDKCMAINSEIEPVFLGRSLADRVPLSEIPTVLSQAGKRVHGDQFKMFAAGICIGWMQRDPAGFLEHAYSGKEPRISPDVFDSQLRGEALKVLCSRDPDKAARLMESLKGRPGFDEKEAKQLYLNGMSVTQPERLLRTLDQLPAHQRLDQLQNASMEIARRNPKRLFEMIASGELPFSPNSGTLQLALASWPSDDSAGALDMIRKITGDQVAPKAMRESLVELASSRPELALQAWSQMGPSENHIGALRSLLDHYGKSDPEKLRQWMDTRSNPEERSVAMSVYAGRMAERQPEAAARLIGEISNPPDRSLAVSAIARTWATTDPAASWAWISQNGFDGTANDVRPAVLSVLAEKQPDAAMAAAKGLPESERWAGIQSVVNVIAGVDPSKAAAWLADLPDHSQKLELSGGVIRQWAVQDPVGASTWVENLSDSAAREKITEELVEGAWVADPSVAWEWAHRLPVGIRDQRLELLGNRWMLQDYVTARSAIENSSIAPELKKRLLHGMK